MKNLRWQQVLTDTVNTGIYIINQEVMSYIPKGVSFDFSNDLFPVLLRGGKRLMDLKPIHTGVILVRFRIITVKICIILTERIFFPKRESVPYPMALRYRAVYYTAV